jgi:uncharacterized protein
MTSHSAALTRSLLWTRHDRVSLEHFQLQETSAGIRLSGTILTIEGTQPLRVQYTVQCDRGWATRSVGVDCTHGAASRELELIVDDQKRWWSEGKEIAAVAGCIDVDISLSPSTNTLPIRRLSLAPGGESDVVAAWIRFPDLVIEPLPQRYVRTGENLYRYASDGGAFTADIEVDELGLVVSYPPAWERVIQEVRVGDQESGGGREWVAGEDGVFPT